MKSAIVIGGGIVGLSCALYLRQGGWDVTVIDRTNMLDGCSYGNAGYICQSRFIPLASPGVFTDALKWMWSSKSPFYIQPRLDWPLIQWSLSFLKNATKAHVERSMIPLREIALLSQRLFEDWNGFPNFDCGYQRMGLLEFFRSKKGATEAIQLEKLGRKLGMDVVLLNQKETEKMEPELKLDVQGSIHFKGDTHLSPGKLMRSLLVHLSAIGVKFCGNQEVREFLVERRKIIGIRTCKELYHADEIVMATGAWSGEVASRLGVHLLMAAGRGYSMTLDNSPYKLRHPVLLHESHVALTPLENGKLRLGGTMEITKIGTRPKMQRMEGILQGVAQYFPEIQIPMPSPEKVWHGYRPCSGDGLPYIGRTTKYNNLIVATGHGMLGVSFGPATGKLVAEIATGEIPSLDLLPFKPARFG